MIANEGPIVEREPQEFFTLPSYWTDYHDRPMGFIDLDGNRTKFWAKAVSVNADGDVTYKLLPLDRS